MPAPACYYGRTPVWDREVIERWLAERPSVGRPPKDDEQRQGDLEAQR
jgi:hypothetical protein